MNETKHTPVDLADVIIRSDERRKRLNDAAPDLLAALYSALNLEHAAMVGGNCGALNGLDVKYHFDKIRAAIAKAEGKDRGFTAPVRPERNPGRDKRY
ncbi:MAG: hypothetical protein WC455_17865 [Dehalococcoidia bacterium]|jgi:hypothetical protein